MNKEDEEIEKTVEGQPSVEGTEEAAVNPLSMSDDDFDKAEEESRSKRNESSSEEGKAPSANDSQEASTGVKTEVNINYEEEYKKVFTPFKANGKEIKVESLDDVKALMQMGANYSKKMAALKPNLKMMKMLEDNGFLDEQKLNYLIDLGKQKPEAIAKLVKDSKIEPLELDLDRAEGYRPTSRNVPDQRLALDDVFEEIKDTKSFMKTVDIISDKLDTESKRILYERPEYIKSLNTNVENGIYDLIMNEMQKQRDFGRLKGYSSELEAYKAVGDYLAEKGAFDHILKGGSNTNQKPTQPKISQPPQRQASVNQQAERVRQMKMSASTTKSNPVKAKENFNPLSLSDEEFDKLYSNRFK